MPTVSGFGSQEKNLPMADVCFHIQDMIFRLQVWKLKRIWLMWWYLEPTLEMIYSISQKSGGSSGYYKESG